MNTHSRDVLPGQTMFDFLKRKKKLMLEKTLSRNKTHDCDADNTRNHQQTTDFMDKTRRNQSRQTRHRSSHRNHQKIDSQSNTPRRVSFIQEQKRPATRSFLQMISPIRSKSPVPKQVDQSCKSSPRFSKKDSFKENFIKKKMQEKTRNLRCLFDNMVKSGRNLKQKFHFLNIELQPFFRHVQNCDSSKIQKYPSELFRKTEVIKAQLKAVEHNFKQFTTESNEQSFDSFFTHFSQYLNELEGQSLAQIQNNKNGLIAQITQTKNTEIHELKDDRRRLEKQLNNLRKQYQNLLTRYEQMQSQTNERFEKTQISQKQVLQRYNTQLQQQKTQNKHLKQQLEELSQSLSQKEQQIKSMLYQRQKYRQECFNTINKVKTEQQQFLLNEIMILKKQFNNDINQMAKLHKTKQEQHLFRIKDISCQNQKLRKQIDCMIKSNLEMEQVAKTNQSQSSRFKKQNQMLAIDMHRINEELYQHWLALKDIKILSLRLDIFPKFKKIYEQMLFNQQLFL